MSRLTARTWSGENARVWFPRDESLALVGLGVSDVTRLVGVAPRTGEELFRREVAGSLVGVVFRGRSGWALTKSQEGTLLCTQLALPEGEVLRSFEVPLPEGARFLDGAAEDG